MKAKKNKSMLEVSKGYEEFIGGKKLKNKSATEFDKTIKKAILNKPKPRGLK